MDIEIWRWRGTKECPYEDQRSILWQNIASFFCQAQHTIELNKFVTIKYILWRIKLAHNTTRANTFSWTMCPNGVGAALGMSPHLLRVPSITCLGTLPRKTFTFKPKSTNYFSRNLRHNPSEPSLLDSCKNKTMVYCSYHIVCKSCNVGLQEHCFQMRPWLSCH